MSKRIKRILSLCMSVVLMLTVLPEMNYKAAMGDYIWVQISDGSAPVAGVEIELVQKWEEGDQYISSGRGSLITDLEGKVIFQDVDAPQSGYSYYARVRQEDVSGTPQNADVLSAGYGESWGDLPSPSSTATSLGWKYWGYKVIPVSVARTIQISGPANVIASSVSLDGYSKNDNAVNVVSGSDLVINLGLTVKGVNDLDTRVESLRLTASVEGSNIDQYIAGLTLGAMENEHADYIKSLTYQNGKIEMELDLSQFSSGTLTMPLVMSFVNGIIPNGTEIKINDFKISGLLKPRTPSPLTYEFTDFDLKETSSQGGETYEYQINVLAKEEWSLKANPYDKSVEPVVYENSGRIYIPFEVGTILDSANYASEGMDIPTAIGRTYFVPDTYSLKAVLSGIIGDAKLESIKYYDGNGNLQDVPAGKIKVSGDGGIGKSIANGQEIEIQYFNEIGQPAYPVTTNFVITVSVPRSDYYKSILDQNANDFINGKDINIDYQWDYDLYGDLGYSLFDQDSVNLGGVEGSAKGSSVKIVKKLYMEDGTTEIALNQYFKTYPDAMFEFYLLNKLPEGNLTPAQLKAFLENSSNWADTFVDGAKGYVDNEDGSGKALHIIDKDHAFTTFHNVFTGKDYYVYEVASGSYTRFDGNATVRANENNEVTVEVKNKLNNNPGNLTFTKIGIENSASKVLEGVKFTLTLKGGSQTYEAISDSNGLVGFYGIPAGAYILTEEASTLPSGKGYVAAEPIEVSIVKGKTVNLPANLNRADIRNAGKELVNYTSNRLLTVVKEYYDAAGNKVSGSSVASGVTMEVYEGESASGTPVATANPVWNGSEISTVISLPAGVNNVYTIKEASDAGNAGTYNVTAVTQKADYSQGATHRSVTFSNYAKKTNISFRKEGIDSKAVVNASGASQGSANATFRLEYKVSGAYQTYTETGKDFTQLKINFNSPLALSLPEGEYRLVETAVPVNIYAPGVTREFTVVTDPVTGKVSLSNASKDGSFDGVDIQNAKLGDLVVSIYDATNSPRSIMTGVTGGTYALYKQESNGTYTKIGANVSMDSSGKVTFKTVSQGNYKVVEVTPPTGYSANKDFTSADNANNPIITVNDFNKRSFGDAAADALGVTGEIEYKLQGKVIVNLTDVITQTGISSVSFDVYKKADVTVNPDGSYTIASGAKSIETKTTGANGNTTAWYLEPGDYVVIQKGSGNGYFMNGQIPAEINGVVMTPGGTNVASISVTAGENKTVPYTNLKKAGFEASKRIEYYNYGKPYAGVVFELYRSNPVAQNPSWELVKTLTTDGDGKISVQSELDPRYQYKLMEKSRPDDGKLNFAPVSGIEFGYGLSKNNAYALQDSGKLSNIENYVAYGRIRVNKEAYDSQEFLDTGSVEIIESANGDRPDYYNGEFKIYEIPKVINGVSIYEINPDGTINILSKPDADTVKGIFDHNDPVDVVISGTELTTFNGKDRYNSGLSKELNAGLYVVVETRTALEVDTPKDEDGYRAYGLDGQPLSFFNAGNSQLFYTLVPVDIKMDSNGKPLQNTAETTVINPDIDYGGGRKHIYGQVYGRKYELVNGNKRDVYGAYFDLYNSDGNGNAVGTPIAVNIMSGNMLDKELNALAGEFLSEMHLLGYWENGVFVPNTNVFVKEEADGKTYAYFVLKETKAPNGFSLNENNFEVKIEITQEHYNRSQQVEIPNTRNSARLTITKYGVNGGSNQLLGGVTFEVYYTDDVSQSMYKPLIVNGQHLKVKTVSGTVAFDIPYIPGYRYYVKESDIGNGNGEYIQNNAYHEITPITLNTPKGIYEGGVTVYNYKKGGIDLVKKYIGGSNVEGARFELYYLDGSVWKRYSFSTGTPWEGTSNKDGRVSVSNLPNGEYRLVEVETAADSYFLYSVKNPDGTINWENADYIQYSVNVTGSGNGVSITGKNNPIYRLVNGTSENITDNWLYNPKKGKVSGSKALVNPDGTIQTTNIPAGITFVISKEGDPDFTPTTTTVGSDGTFSFSGLKAGSYKVREAEGLPGFIPDDTVYDVTITYAGEQIVLNTGNAIKNYSKKGKLTITKADVNGNPIANNPAEFTVYNATVDGNGQPNGYTGASLATLTTNNNGKASTVVLEGGKWYCVMETGTPTGYSVDGTVAGDDVKDSEIPGCFYVFVKNVKENPDYQVTYKNNKLGSLVVTKTSKALTDKNGDPLPLAGAEIRLYPVVDNGDGTYKLAAGDQYRYAPDTNANGSVTFQYLEAGKYAVIEWKAPVNHAIASQYSIDNWADVTTESGNIVVTPKDKVDAGNVAVVDIEANHGAYSLTMVDPVATAVLTVSLWDDVNTTTPIGNSYDPTANVFEIYEKVNGNWKLVTIDGQSQFTTGENGYFRVSLPIGENEGSKDFIVVQTSTNPQSGYFPDMDIPSTEKSFGRYDGLYSDKVITVQNGMAYEYNAYNGKYHVDGGKPVKKVDDGTGQWADQRVTDISLASLPDGGAFDATFRISGIFEGGNNVPLNDFVVTDDGIKYYQTGNSIVTPDKRFENGGYNIQSIWFEEAPKADKGELYVKYSVKTFTSAGVSGWSNWSAGYAVTDTVNLPDNTAAFQLAYFTKNNEGQLIPVVGTGFYGGVLLVAVSFEKWDATVYKDIAKVSNQAQVRYTYGQWKLENGSAVKGSYAVDNKTGEPEITFHKKDIRKAQVSLRKSALTATVMPGGTVNYKITLTNDSPTEKLYAPVVADKPSSDMVANTLTVSKITAAGIDITKDSGKFVRIDNNKYVCWYFKDYALEPGQSITIEYSIQVSKTPDLSNVVKTNNAFASSGYFLPPYEGDAYSWDVSPGTGKNVSSNIMEEINSMLKNEGYYPGSYQLDWNQNNRYAVAEGQVTVTTSNVVKAYKKVKGSYEGEDWLDSSTSTVYAKSPYGGELTFKMGVTNYNKQNNKQMIETRIVDVVPYSAAANHYINDRALTLIGLENTSGVAATFYGKTEIVAQTDIQKALALKNNGKDGYEYEDLTSLGWTEITDFSKNGLKDYKSIAVQFHNRTDFNGKVEFEMTVGSTFEESDKANLPAWVYGDNSLVRNIMNASTLMEANGVKVAGEPELSDSAYGKFSGFSASISGFVWNDKNDNSEWDAGEMFIEDAKVHLTRSLNGVEDFDFNNQNHTVRTNEDGFYIFKNLEAYIDNHSVTTGLTYNYKVVIEKPEEYNKYSNVYNNITIPDEDKVFVPQGGRDGLYLKDAIDIPFVNGAFSNIYKINLVKTTEGYVAEGTQFVFSLYKDETFNTPIQSPVVITYPGAMTGSFAGLEEGTYYLVEQADDYNGEITVTSGASSGTVTKLTGTGAPKNGWKLELNYGNVGEDTYVDIQVNNEVLNDGKLTLKKVIDREQLVNKNDTFSFFLTHGGNYYAPVLDGEGEMQVKPDGSVQWAATIAKTAIVLSANEAITFAGLPRGVYSLKEEVSENYNGAPVYKITVDGVETVNQPGAACSITLGSSEVGVVCENTVKSGNLTLKKVRKDAYGTEDGSNYFRFEILKNTLQPDGTWKWDAPEFMAGGKAVASGYVDVPANDANGVVLTGLPYGEYRIREIMEYTVDNKPVFGEYEQFVNNYVTSYHVNGNTNPEISNGGLYLVTLDDDAIGANGAIQSITALNAEKAEGKITITKVVEPDCQLDKNVVFEVQIAGSKGDSFVKYFKAGETVEFAGLKPDTYVVEELGYYRNVTGTDPATGKPIGQYIALNGSGPVHYSYEITGSGISKVNGKYQVEVKNVYGKANEITLELKNTEKLSQVIVIKSQYLFPDTVDGVKQDAVAVKVPEGIRFELVKTDGTVAATGKTPADGSGKVEFKGISHGEYYIREYVLEGYEAFIPDLSQWEYKEAEGFYQTKDIIEVSVENSEVNNGVYGVQYEVDNQEAEGRIIVEKTWNGEENVKLTDEMAKNVKFTLGVDGIQKEYVLHYDEANHNWQRDAIHQGSYKLYEYTMDGWAPTGNDWKYVGLAEFVYDDNGSERKDYFQKYEYVGGNGYIAVDGSHVDREKLEAAATVEVDNGETLGAVAVVKQWMGNAKFEDAPFRFALMNSDGSQLVGDVKNLAQNDDIMAYLLKKADSDMGSHRADEYASVKQAEQDMYKNIHDAVDGQFAMGAVFTNVAKGVYRVYEFTPAKFIPESGWKLDEGFDWSLLEGKTDVGLEGYLAYYQDVAIGEGEKFLPYQVNSGLPQMLSVYTANNGQNLLDLVVTKEGQDGFFTALFNKMYFGLDDGQESRIAGSDFNPIDAWNGKAVVRFDNLVPGTYTLTEYSRKAYGPEYVNARVWTLHGAVYLKDDSGVITETDQEAESMDGIQYYKYSTTVEVFIPDQREDVSTEYVQYFTVTNGKQTSSVKIHKDMYEGVNGTKVTDMEGKITFQLVKVDENNVPLAGQEEIYAHTDAKGDAIFNGVTDGRYVVKETNRGAGYATSWANDISEPFNLPDEAEEKVLNPEVEGEPYVELVYELELTNREDFGTVTVEKFIHDRSEGRRPATEGERTFTLAGEGYDVTKTTDENGKVVFENVPYGEYTLKETPVENYTTVWLSNGNDITKPITGNSIQVTVGEKVDGKGVVTGVENKAYQVDNNGMGSISIQKKITGYYNINTIPFEIELWNVTNPNEPVLVNRSEYYADAPAKRFTVPTGNYQVREADQHDYERVFGSNDEVYQVGPYDNELYEVEVVVTNYREDTDTRTERPTPTPTGDTSTPTPTPGPETDPTPTPGTEVTSSPTPTEEPEEYLPEETLPGAGTKVDGGDLPSDENEDEEIEEVVDGPVPAGKPNPKTGDSMDVQAQVVITLAAICALTGLAIIRSRRRKSR